VAERIFKALRQKTYPVDLVEADAGKPATIRVTAGKTDNLRSINRTIELDFGELAREVRRGDGGGSVLPRKGESGRLPERRLEALLAARVAVAAPPDLDLELVRQAAARGLSPSLTEHLSSAMPLVVGGTDDASNLEVMDGAAHLDVLGQMLAQMEGLPDGTPIRSFDG
jgi:hypothetical protein